MWWSLVLNVHHRLEFAVFTNDESGAQDAVKLAPHEFLGAPRTIFVGSGMIFVTEQLKVQLIALYKFGQLLDRVGADAEDYGIEAALAESRNPCA